MNKNLIIKYTIFLLIITIFASLIPIGTLKLSFFFDKNEIMLSSLLFGYLVISILFIVSIVYMGNLLIKAKTLSDIVSMAIVFTIILVIWKIIDNVYIGLSIL